MRIVLLARSGPKLMPLVQDTLGRNQNMRPNCVLRISQEVWTRCIKNEGERTESQLKVVVMLPSQRQLPIESQLVPSTGRHAHEPHTSPEPLNHPSEGRNFFSSSYLYLSPGAPPEGLTPTHLNEVPWPSWAAARAAILHCYSREPHLSPGMVEEGRTCGPARLSLGTEAACLQEASWRPCRRQHA